MNRTTVDSSKRNTTTVAGGEMIVTEKELKIPPQTVVYEELPNYLAEYGDMGIKVENSSINEKNELRNENGNIIMMMNPKSFSTLVEYKKRRENMKSKIKTKTIAKDKNER